MHIHYPNCWEAAGRGHTQGQAGLDSKAVSKVKKGGRVGEKGREGEGKVREGRRETGERAHELRVEHHAH